MLNLLPSMPMSMRINLFTYAPKVLRPSLRFIPHQCQQYALLSALHSVFKDAIKEGELDFLQDKWLKITITDLDLSWLLSIKDNKFIMAPRQSSLSGTTNISETVSFSAAGDDLLLIAGRKEDPDTLFFQRRLKIEGDTELGLEVKNVIDAIDLDNLPSILHSWVNFLAAQLQQVKQAQNERSRD
ncbi:ubiquinone anaerobic biosynthesis accessory factor UbiT [Shewanella surugensis]|uniref:Ubiquinone biosynthesis accessory factor UbiT n=1 Tax=Shewanella surugensis TaxID=212020 RepID=A0ABT0LDT6_9GAMM|nr:SCP2 sterol-binding domain-containing protein [Shewanella surugensis]MCL1125869.1 SCP2 sterol-binding domain-containing protein [Shewanella surugensis]